MIALFLCSRILHCNHLDAVSYGTIMVKPMASIVVRSFFLCLILILLPQRSSSQTSTRVTDASNPIVSDTGPEQYSGASWVDFDGEGVLDLFANNSKLYRNDGGGTFVSLVANLGSGQPITASIIGNGNSWEDYDNDGGGIFTKISSGAIGNGANSPCWACAWADYNNEGYVDLAITHPANFIPVTPTPNHLFLYE